MTIPELVPLLKSIERFHETAMSKTGLSNFGENDYLPRLERLMAACDEEGGLNEAMYRFVCEQVTNTLCARLIGEENLRQFPECLSHTIERPIIIVGLPRSGTTALHRLLASDPRNQVVELWLAGSPMPRPPREEWESNPVFQANKDFFVALSESSSDTRAYHEMAPHLADECSHLLFQDFVSPSVSAMVRAIGFDKWLLDADITEPYERHGRMLRLIGSTSPEKRWVIKDPPNLSRLNLLLKLYPDACIVHIHRDPVQTIPSLCSLMSTMHRASGGNDPAFLPEREMMWWPVAMRRALEVRRQFPQSFFDLSFKDFVSNPVGSVEAVYKHFDLGFPEQGRSAVKSHAEGNKRDKHGAHSYTAEEFGFSDEGLREQFQFYFDACEEYL